MSDAHDPAASGTHDPVKSAGHDAAISAAGGHGTVLSGFHDPVRSEGHDPVVSGAHDPFASGLHSADLSAAHDPISSGGHDATVSAAHDTVLSGAHAADVSALHDPVKSGVHNATLSAAHDPLASGAHRPETSGGHEPTVSGLHSPTVSTTGAHAAALSGLHEAAVSAAHSAADSALHDAVVSSAHDSAISGAHSPLDSAGHSPITSGLHNPIASGAHEPTISAGHNPNLSGLHTPALSGGHDPAVSANHDPIASRLGEPGGPPPVVPFDDVFDFEDQETGDSGSETRAFGNAGGHFYDGVLGWSRALVVSYAGATGGIAGSPMTPEEGTEAALLGALAISLGLQPGARLVDLGVHGQAILPADFRYTDGWDAPPRGSIFDLGDGVDGMMLAPVESTLPPGLTWNVDFFLPAAEISVRTGFNAVTFTGAAGTDVGDFAEQFGDGLQSIWRYNAALQSWEGWAPGRPAAVNTLRTLGSRDAVLVKSSGSVASFQALDLIPRGTSVARSVTLRPGANLVSYTGSGGDIAAITAGIAGLQSALVYDAVDQRWLTFIPGAPAIVNDFSTLRRLDAVYLVLGGPASCTFEE